MYRIGVDIGGTYTDAFVLNEDTGRVEIVKVPTTPRSPEKAVLESLASIDLSATSVISHGTTIVTNAVIQRRLAPSCLVTTKGFRDVLEIRRGDRPVCDVQYQLPKVLIPRRHRFELEERTKYNGQVLAKPTSKNITRLVRMIRDTGIKNVAICFLNSYANPQNELLVKRALKRLDPSLNVVVSFDVVPIWREFIRTCTTVLNVAIMPLLETYLGRLRDGLRTVGYNSTLLVMLSNGGVSNAEVAHQHGAQMLQSGPAAGAIAAREICAEIGEKNVITFDMGGTSCDVSLIHGGEVRTTEEQEIEFGTVIGLPTIDITSIGAGGGSMAKVESNRYLRVGPESAGAEPGPACYGKGGERATVTDANVVLGRLHPEYLLGGKFKIDKRLAEVAVEQEVAKTLGLDLVSAAMGIIRIVNNNMKNAVREITVARGVDPREFALFAFGGAGALHAVEVAKELSIQRVVVPPFPGMTCAVGLALSDIRHDFLRTALMSSRAIDYKLIERNYKELEEKARKTLREEGVNPQSMELIRMVDARYEGQTHELPIRVSTDVFDEKANHDLIREFNNKHLTEFAYAFEGDPIEIVNLRVHAVGHLKKLKPSDLSVGQQGKEASRPTIVAHREVHFSENSKLETPIYRRDSLSSGDVIKGPAIIEQLDTTTLIPPGAKALADRIGNITIQIG